MKITGEVIFRSFFGQAQLKMENGQLYSEELAWIILEIGSLVKSPLHVFKMLLFGLKYWKNDFLLDAKMLKCIKRFLSFKKLLINLIETRI